MTAIPAVSRRRFLVAAAGGALLLAGCAGDKVRSATLVDFLGKDRRPGDPLWSPEARAYVAAFPPEYLPKAKALYTDDQYASVALGLVALSIVCPKDQIEVGWCGIDDAFFCPLCGTYSNAVGEVLAGPAPRGLDRYWVSKDKDGNLVIDRSRKVRGPLAGPLSLPAPGPSTTFGGTCTGSASRKPDTSGKVT